MILIAWFVITLAVLAIGIILWQPWWLIKFIQQRSYCARCHEDITQHQRYQLQYKASQSLEERQV